MPKLNSSFNSVFAMVSEVLTSVAATAPAPAVAAVVVGFGVAVGFEFGGDAAHVAGDGVDRIAAQVAVMDDYDQPVQ